MFVGVVGLFGVTTPTNIVRFIKELLILTGTETFAKEPKFAELLQES